MNIRCFPSLPSTHPSVGNSTRCSGRSPRSQPSPAQTLPEASTKVVRRTWQLSPDPDAWPECRPREVNTGGPEAEKSQ